MTSPPIQPIPLIMTTEDKTRLLESIQNHIIKKVTETLASKFRNQSLGLRGEQECLETLSTLRATGIQTLGVQLQHRVDVA